MKVEKQTGIMAAVAAVLLVTLLAGLMFPALFPDKQDVRSLLGKIAQASVHEMEFSVRGEGTNQIRYSVKKDSKGIWTLTSQTFSIQIEAREIEEGLALLLKSSTRRLVSQSGVGAEKLGFASVGTDATQFAENGTIVVKGSSKEVLGTIALGKIESNGLEVYIRIANQAAIYTSDRALIDFIGRKPEHYISKKLFIGVNPDLLRSFEIETKTGLRRYQKNAEQTLWTDANVDSLTNTETDATKLSESIASLLRQVQGLEANSAEFVDESSYVGRFTGLQKAFTISLSGDQSFAVELWKPESSGDTSADTNSDYLVRELSPQKSLDGKIRLLSLPQWKVGDLALR